MKSSPLERLAAIVIVATCLCVFGGVTKNGFVNFDDGPYVYANPHVQSGLNVQGLLWAMKSTSAANWHPVTWLSHMLDCEFYGLNPAGHHLTNLILHIANVLLLFLFLRNTTGRFWESAAVAFLFAVHPLRVESVAWISERKDVLSAFFALLTILAYDHYSKQPSPTRYALSLILFATGLMAKPMLVTLPFVLLLLDFWPLDRCKISGIRAEVIESSLPLPAERSKRGIGDLVTEKVPFFALSAASSLVTYYAQHKGGAVSSFEIIPIKVRLLNAFLSYWNYLKKIFLPQDLAAFYPHPGSQLAIWKGIAAALFLMAVSFIVIRHFRRRPFLVTGWFWFLGMMVPVLGIIQVGGQSMADRYTYLPSIGILIMIAWTPGSLPWRGFHHHLLLAVGFTAIVIYLSSLTWIQTGYWKDTRSLFSHAASVTANNHLAHCFLGDVLSAENKLVEAQHQYEKALIIWPQFPEALNNLGMLLTKRGLHREAMNYYEEALRARPNYALAHINIANALAERGDLDAAASHYSEALRIDPDSGLVQNALGALMARMNKLDQAVLHLTRAVELCPQCAEPHNNLGRALTLQGNFGEAVKHLQRAIELAPTYAEAYNNMGLVYLQLGALEEALYYMSSALHFREDYTKARMNLRHIAALIGQQQVATQETGPQ